MKHAQLVPHCTWTTPCCSCSFPSYLQLCSQAAASVPVRVCKCVAPLRQVSLCSCISSIACTWHLSPSSTIYAASCRVKSCLSPTKTITIFTPSYLHPLLCGNQKAHHTSRGPLCSFLGHPYRTSWHPPTQLSAAACFHSCRFGWPRRVT